MSMELDGPGNQNATILSVVIIQWLLSSVRLLCKETIMIASNSAAKRLPKCMETFVAQLSTSSA
jgi:hypothetical protein